MRYRISLLFGIMPARLYQCFFTSFAPVLRNSELCAVDKQASVFQVYGSAMDTKYVRDRSIISHLNYFKPSFGRSLCGSSSSRLKASQGTICTTRPRASRNGLARTHVDAFAPASRRHCVRARARARARTHTHTHTHTHNTHTSTHTHTHARAHTHKHTNTQNTHIYTHNCRDCTGHDVLNYRQCHEQLGKRVYCRIFQIISRNLCKMPKKDIKPNFKDRQNDSER